MLVLGAIAFARLRLGYARPDARLEVIGPGEAAFLRAAAQTLFPVESSGPSAPAGLRDGGDIDLPGYMDGYLKLLPFRQRLLLRVLLLLFEHSTLLFPARGLGAFRRFSSMTSEQRQHVLRSWEGSRLYLRRVAFTALKAVMVLGYVGDHENLRALGLSPWKIESPVIETDLIYPPIGKRPEQIELTLEDLPAPGAQTRAAPPLRSEGAR